MTTSDEQLIQNLGYAIAQLGGCGCSASKGYVQDAVDRITELAAELARLRAVIADMTELLITDAAAPTATPDVCPTCKGDGVVLSGGGEHDCRHQE